MKNIILLFLVITLFKTAHSQTTNSSAYNSKIYQEEYTTPAETKFEIVSTGKELNSTTSVSSMIQDNDGFIWFTTMYGIIRFDGYTTQIFYGYSGSYSAINCVFKDNEGTLWFGTNEGSIIMYEKNSEKFDYINLNNDKKNPFSGINSIIENKTGDLIIGTYTSGLKIFDKNEKKLKYHFKFVDSTKNGISSNKISSLFADRNGLIYIGTDKGLDIFNIAKETFTNFQNIPNDNHSISNNIVKCIYQDINDNIWIGTSIGLNLFDKKNNNFTRFMNEADNSKSISHNNITGICKDKDNELWITTFGGGLNKYEKDGSFTNVKPIISNQKGLMIDFMSELFVDNSNVLWLISNAGVCKLDCSRKKFFTISKFFNNSKFSNTEEVSSIYIDSSNVIWVAQKIKNGIFKFIKNKNGLLDFEDYLVVPNLLRNESISSCLEDKNNDLWFCSNNRMLFQYKICNNRFKIFKINNNFADDFLQIRYLKNNCIFIATRNSNFLKFDIDKKEFLNLNSNSKILDSLSSYGVAVNFVDNENNIWITPATGELLKYDVEKDKITNYTYDVMDSNNVKNNDGYISGISDDNKGNLLIGTNVGISRIDKSNNIIKYLLGVEVNNIIEDSSGYLWFTNINGLNKFDPRKRTIRNYDENDGLQGNDFYLSGASVKDKDGILYFGGSNGLTYFNPSEIKDNPYIPNVVITDFKIFNESVKPSHDNPFLKQSITETKEINLSFKESVFSFEFAALIYNNPSKNQYAYMMEGFDKDWVYCGTRRNVTYTNLDPGDYTFRVKGSNNDGIWNEEGTSIKITITPPWWQTWWFKSCGAALIFVTVGFGFKKRFNKLNKEKLAQEEYSRKLLASQESERKRIANELHDSIAHDILILKNNAVIAMNNTKDEEAKSAFNEISEQSSSTLNEVRSISYNLHPHQIEALGITKAIKSMIDKVSKSSNIKFLLEEDVIDNLFTEENEVYIFRIIQEVINNIIKHSSATEAIIKISRKEESVSIIISDNGKGFSLNKDVSKNSLGLSGISERVKMLNGTMKIESEKGEGTIFKIDLPTSPQLSS